MRYERPAVTALPTSGGSSRFQRTSSFQTIRSVSDVRPGDRSGKRPEQPAYRRPFGITLLTVYDLLMVAIVPSGLAMSRFMTQPAAERPDLLVVFAAILLGGGIVVTSAAVFRGENWSRYVLTALVTIYYVGLIIGAPFAVDVAAAVAGSDGGAFETTLRVGRSVFWILLHGWYFFSAVSWFYEGRRPPTNRLPLA